MTTAEYAASFARVVERARTVAGLSRTDEDAPRLVAAVGELTHDVLALVACDPEPNYKPKPVKRPPKPKPKPKPVTPKPPASSAPSSPPVKRP